MSSTAGTCTFADGTVKYFMYYSTVDRICIEQLFETAEAAWAAWTTSEHLGPWAYYGEDNPEWLTISQEPDEPVVLSLNRGEGVAWEGRATRRYVTSGYEAPFVLEAMDVSRRTSLISGSWQRFLHLFWPDR